MQCRAAGALLPYHTPSPRRFLLCQLPLGHFKSLQIWPHVSHSRTCLALTMDQSKAGSLPLTNRPQTWMQQTLEDLLRH